MSRRTPLILVSLAATALVAGCGSSGGGSAPSQAFVLTTNDNGWGEIWLMDANGGHRVQLTASRPPDSQAAGNTNPAWSPNGKQIAYTGTGDWPDNDPAHQEIYVMDGQGKNVKQLTNNTVPDWSPKWSPDGKHIAFAEEVTAGRDDLHSALFTMNADGSGKKLLFKDKSVVGSHLVFDPVYSPDGSTIAFMRVTYGQTSATSNVYVMKTDGTGMRKLLTDAAEPSWSHDGKEIAFTSTRDHYGQSCFDQCQPSGEIYVANADGSNPRRLTHSKADDASPTWSPDGKQIAFVSDMSNRKAHQNEIYVMSATGGPAKRLTNNTVWDLEPDWKY